MLDIRETILLLETRSSSNIRYAHGSTFYNGDTKICLEVSKNSIKPRRPVGEVWDKYFSERLWALLERCWNREPAFRPNISDVLQELSALHVTN